MWIRVVGNFNLSKRFTNGLDLTFNWRKDMAGGEFGVNTSVNKLTAQRERIVGGWFPREVPS